MKKSNRQVLKLLESDNAEEKSELEQLLSVEGLSLKDYNGAWKRFNTLVQDLPISEKDLMRDNSGASWTVNAEEVTYFVKLIEVKLKTQVAPIELVKKEIGSILLNRKKSELLEKMRYDLFKDAEQKGNILIND